MTQAHIQVEHNTQRIASRTSRGTWRVEISSGDETRCFPLGQGERVLIGTAHHCDVRIHDQAVSAQHVCLEVCEEGLQVRDLESTNGTFVGNARVRHAVLTETGGSILIGRTLVRAQLTRRPRHLTGAEPIAGLVGKSPAMRELTRQIRRYAKLQAPVLLQGESGTGKEVVARALHELSGRAGRFVALNVGGLAEALADSELFGHRKGAFTGAVRTRVGAFEEAGAGTLFLDEIGDLDPAIQVKLLRVIEERSFRPLGGGTSASVEARIVSACWAPLEQRSRQGIFRADLFHRISTITVQIPPLRERRSDIAELSEVLLGRYAGEFGHKELTREGLSLLLSYDWPGNVRELGAVLYRAAANAVGAHLGPADIERALPDGRRRMRGPTDPETAALRLQQYEGNVSAAARSLGVPRSTFRAWLRKRDPAT